MEKWGEEREEERERIKEYEVYYCVVKKRYCWCEEIGSLIIKDCLFYYLYKC